MKRILESKEKQSRKRVAFLGKTRRAGITKVVNNIYIRKIYNLKTQIYKSPEPINGGQLLTSIITTRKHKYQQKSKKVRNRRTHNTGKILLRSIIKRIILNIGLNQTFSNRNCFTRFMEHEQTKETKTYFDWSEKGIQNFRS